MQLFTLTAPATVEFGERGSRFIGTLVPWQQFESTLAASRDAHRKASHHVTAFRRMTADNRIVENARDDGEPAGTAGVPALKVLAGASLIDAGLIIVRYFGGTMLGTGGLARAYTATALRAVDAATLVPWSRMARHSFSSRFENMSLLEQRMAAAELKILGRTFNDDGVVMTVEGPEDTIAAIIQELDQG